MSFLCRVVRCSFDDRVRSSGTWDEFEVETLFLCIKRSHREMINRPTGLGMPWNPLRSAIGCIWERKVCLDCWNLWCSYTEDVTTWFKYALEWNVERDLLITLCFTLPWIVPHSCQILYSCQNLSQRIFDTMLRRKTFVLHRTEPPGEVCLILLSFDIIRIYFLQ